MSARVLSNVEHQQDLTSPPQRTDQSNSVLRRWWKPILLTVGVVALLLAAVSVRHTVSLPHTGPLSTHKVTRSDLVITVAEQGTIESAKNTEIKCRIRGGYGGHGGHSTVTWVIDAGSVVQSGDELVRLDTRVIEETVSLGKTDTNIAKAELARAKADLAKAEVAIDAYLHGRYRSQMKSLEKEMEEKKWNLRTAQKMQEHSTALFKRGYLTELELIGNGHTVTQAELELKVKETEIDVLSRLTKAMELETLNGQLTATSARLEGRKAGLALEEARLKLALEELESCVIKAPQEGLVIYPSTARWKNAPDVTAGASVHNNQVLLLMPDLSQLRVTIGIHESVIDRIKTGLSARVALLGRTLDAKVSSVAAVASPAGWWTGNEVKYEVTIDLPTFEGLNPGMTAQVEVVVAEHANVMSVPVSAVVETDLGRFCWIDAPTGAQRRSLQLGDSNDEFIVVESGLEEGDEVVLDPLTSIADARELVAPPSVHTVGRGDLFVTSTEQGTLESSNNEKIKCRVRGASTINWVIESGTSVEAGDELVRLENKKIEDYLHERTKFAYLSKDAAVGFRAQATRAGIAISEYLEGRYRTELMTLEKDLAIAKVNRLTAQNLLDHAQLMAEGGYVSELEVEEKEFAVLEAELELEVRRNRIDVLKRFTKPEELETLKGNWEAEKAAANGHEEVLAMDEARIAVARKEMERCVIKAERSGLVIYPTAEAWKNAPDIAEGATVHNDQVLLLMPDLATMQVKVGIHESIVDRIKPGMAAKVTLPDKTLDGEVISVASTALPAGWWTGNMVKYDTIVRLPSAPGLKPGMSAEVEVIMACHEDVLLLPVSAVVEVKQEYYCWVGTARAARRRSLQLGDSNGTFTVVEAGLQEGEQVVLNPTAIIGEAKTLAELQESR